MTTCLTLFPARWSRGRCRMNFSGRWFVHVAGYTRGGFRIGWGLLSLLAICLSIWIGIWGFCSEIIDLHGKGKVEVTRRGQFLAIRIQGIHYSVWWGDLMVIVWDVGYHWWMLLRMSCPGLFWWWSVDRSKCVMYGNYAPLLVWMSVFFVLFIVCIIQYIINTIRNTPSYPDKIS